MAMIWNCRGIRIEDNATDDAVRETEPDRGSNPRGSTQFVKVVRGPMKLVFRHYLYEASNRGPL